MSTLLHMLPPLIPPVTTTIKVLLVTPFPFLEGAERYNVNVDAVVSRHSGAKMKNGVTYPTGLGYISAFLKQHGVACQLLDVIPQSISNPDVLKSSRDADVIITPISSTRFVDTREYLQAFSDKIRIGIGNFASLYAERLIGDDICDVVVHGEVEHVCLELVRAFGESRSPDLSAISGISWRKSERAKAGRTPDRQLNKGLDAMPFPDRNGLDHYVYTDIAFFGEPTAFILTARGCPFKCTFCSTHLTYKYSVNYRSPENVVAEVEEVVVKHGLRNIFFIDDTFTLIPGRVNRMCDLIIEKNLDIRWACLGRIDVVNDTMLEKMKAAGCIEIRYGIESGSDAVLDNVRKDLTVAEIERGIALMQKHDIRYTVFFMLGNPGETVETMRETIRFAKKLNAIFASFNIATPLPGSPLFDVYRDKFSFDDISTFNTLSSNFSMCDVPATTLQRYLRYAYLSYYLRPAFFAKLAAELFRQPRETSRMMRFLLTQAKAVLAG